MGMIILVDYTSTALGVDANLQLEYLVGEQARKSSLRVGQVCCTAGSAFLLQCKIARTWRWG